MVGGPSPIRRNTPSTNAGKAQAASSAQSTASAAMASAASAAGAAAAASDVKKKANELLESKVEGELHEASKETEEKSSDILKSIVKSLSDNNKHP